MSHPELIGAKRIGAIPGVYRTTNGDWFVRVTITQGGYMLKDIGRAIDGSRSLKEVVNEREMLKAEVKRSLVKTPEFAEILDKNGSVIYAMKRDHVVDSRVSLKRNPELDSFLEEVKDKDDILRD